MAEGIETPSQLEALLIEECDLGQGFVFARPLEPSAVEQLLASGVPTAGRGGELPTRMRDEIQIEV